MSLSFKEFVTDFLGMKLPVKEPDAASKAGYTTKPISTRGLINSAAPYGPKVGAVAFLNCSQNVASGGMYPQVTFAWVDEAVYGSPPGNPKRAATSWQLTVWEGPTMDPKSTVPVINKTLNTGSESGGVIKYDYTGIQLHGEYVFEISATNDFGTAAVKFGPEAITVPGTSPQIKVTNEGGPNQLCTITGSGFTPGGDLKVLVWAPNNGGWGIEETIVASPTGEMSTFEYCKSVCTEAQGGQLQFTVTDNATGAVSNQWNENCA